jgi:hypothetical protein
MPNNVWDDAEKRIAQTGPSVWDQAEASLQPTVFDVLKERGKLYQGEAEKIIASPAEVEKKLAALPVPARPPFGGPQQNLAIMGGPLAVPGVKLKVDSGVQRISDISTLPPDRRDWAFKMKVLDRSVKFTPNEVEQIANLPEPYRQTGFDKAMLLISKSPGPMEAKNEETRQVVRSYTKALAGSIQAAVQADPDRRATQAAADEQRAKFGAKTWNRWDRSATVVVGGGLHLAEELTRLVTLGKNGDTAAEWADIYYDVLQRPEMQPVVDNWFDKIAGGGTEMAAPILAMIAEAVVLKRVGAINPRFASASSYLTKSANFLSTYGMESNAIYQQLKNKGYDGPDARMRGVIGGLLNAGIEVGGGSGEKYLDRATYAAMTKLQKANYYTRKILRTAIAEGLQEEVPQDIVSMILGDDVPKMENGSIDWAKVANQLIDTAIVGTVVGAALSAPFAAFDVVDVPTFSGDQSIPVSGTAVSIPGHTYAEAVFRAEDGTNGKNPWIKQDTSKTNSKRVLLVQFASDLLTKGLEDPSAKAYYDKLYASRPGYTRLGDTWEIPKWITEASFFVPDSDVYFVRDMAEAKSFLQSSGYQKIMMSALDVNAGKIKELVTGYKGRL